MQKERLDVQRRRSRQGRRHDLKGKTKEGAGKLTGDRDLEAEGNLDQAKGKGQKALGDVKDAFKK